MHTLAKTIPFAFAFLMFTTPLPRAGADADEAKGSQTEESHSNLLPNGRRVGDLLVGGPPSVEQLEAIAKAGFKALITLRTPEEPDTDGAKERATAAGLKFFSLPVKGPKGINVTNAKALAKLLVPKDRKPTVVHCGTGQRASTLIGLKAFVADGATKDEAIALAKSLGMVRFEKVLRDRITAYCEKNPGPNCN